MEIKVLSRQKDGKLLSAFTRGRACATYIPGRWSYPPIPGSLLFLCATYLEATKLWAPVALNHEIWEGEIQGLSKIEVVTYAAAPYETMVGVWNNLDLFTGELFSPRYGYRACEAFKPVRRLE